MDAFYYYYPDGSAHKTIPTRGNYSLCPIYHQYICYIFFGEWSQLNRALCYPRVKTKCGMKYDKVGFKMVAVIAFASYVFILKCMFQYSWDTFCSLVMCEWVPQSFAYWSAFEKREMRKKFRLKKLIDFPLSPFYFYSAFFLSFIQERICKAIQKN